MSSMKRLSLVILLAALSAWGLATSSDSSGVSYYVASLASEAESLAIEGHQPQGDTFATANDATPIVRTATPLLEIPAAHIVEARAHEVAEPGPGSPEPWIVVRLDFSDEYRARVDRLYSLYAHHYLLLSLSGSLVDLEPLGAYPSEGFPGGVFRSMEEARDAYESAGVSLSVVEALPAAAKEHERFEREYRSAALWFAKCDPETFAELRGEGIEAFIGVVGKEDLDYIDCDQESPPFPPPPPGRPEVCTEASAKGSLKDGERDGVWSIVNPYGQEIRLDYYRDGKLVRSAWLRDCGDGRRDAAASAASAPSPP